MLATRPCIRHLSAPCWQARAAPLETEQQARARPHTVPFERKAPAAQYNSARHALEPSAEDEGFALGTPGAVDADFLMGLELPSLPMGSSGSPEASAVGSHLEGDSDGGQSLSSSRGHTGKPSGCSTLQTAIEAPCSSSGGRMLHAAEWHGTISALLPGL